MAHTLIVGMTESGKTTLARKLALRIRSLGFEVLVLDPIPDPDWPTDHVYTDSAKFLDVAHASRKCLLVIDEAAETVGRYKEEMKWAATRARHQGHGSIFCVQRAADLSKTVRDQCTRLYAFRSSPDDGKVLANDWVCPALLEVATLPQGECIAVKRFGAPGRIDVFERAQGS